MIQSVEPEDNRLAVIKSPFASFVDCFVAATVAGVADVTQVPTLIYQTETAICFGNVVHGFVVLHLGRETDVVSVIVSEVGIRFYGVGEVDVSICNPDSVKGQVFGFQRVYRRHILHIFAELG